MEDNPELIARIEQWLAKTGYPLEVSVANALREARFGFVVPSDYYEEEGGVQREIDVHAGVSIGHFPNQVQVELAIECKRNAEKPWIIFTRDSKADAVNHAQHTPCHGEPGRNASFIRSSAVIEADIFQIPQRTGYMAVPFQSGSEGQPDQAYKALRGVSVAAHSLVRRNEKRKLACSLVFPMVVVDGLLFEATQEPGSRHLAVSGVERVLMEWRWAPQAGSGISYIWVTTLARLEHDAKSLRGDIGLLVQELHGTK